ncbi:MAG: nicotinate (nicotinamide) nucleotide adenylyltransferase [Verrucomicrobiota bacterium]
MKPERIGLFGGSFNPVHLGHQAIVEASLNYLDRVIIMPCRISPHKLDQVNASEMVTTEHRLNMLKACFDENERVEISRWEMDRESISYSWMTLEMLKEANLQAEIVLVMGWDQFIALPTWHRFEDWGREQKYLVFKRAGEGSMAETPEPLADLDVEFASEELPDLSATQVRTKLSKGDQNAKNSLAAEVWNYLHEHELYGIES